MRLGCSGGTVWGWTQSAARGWICPCFYSSRRASQINIVHMSICLYSVCVCVCVCLYIHNAYGSISPVPTNYKFNCARFLFFSRNTFSLPKNPKASRLAERSIAMVISKETAERDAIEILQCMPCLLTSLGRCGVQTPRSPQMDYWGEIRQNSNEPALWVFKLSKFHWLE